MTHLSVEKYDAPDLASFKICVNKIVLNTTSGDKEISLMKEYSVIVGGFDLVATGVAPGEYQGVRLNLDDSCGTDTIRITNTHGTFTSADAIVLRFDGTFTVGGANNKIKLGLQLISENLLNVADNSDLPVESTRSSGNAGSTSRVKRVFITSTPYAGNFGGLTVADSICQTHADNANHIGTFKAWLSDSTTDANQRLSDVGPWYWVDSVTLVAPDLARLSSGSIINGIAKSELGSSTFFTGVWTGTELDGTKVPLGNCSDWTDNSATQSGQAGQQFLSSSNWTAWQSLTCDTPLGIYCFEQ